MTFYLLQNTSINVPETKNVNVTGECATGNTASITITPIVKSDLTSLTMEFELDAKNFSHLVSWSAMGKIDKNGKFSLRFFFCWKKVCSYEMFLLI